MNLINKGVFSWKYYNILEPSKYNDVTDKEQLNKARTAFNKKKHLDSKVLFKVLCWYWKEVKREMKLFISRD